MGESGWIPHSRPTPSKGAAARVAAVIDSGQHAGGEERRAFEAEFADRVGVRHAFAVQTGSAAVHLALLALGVGHGSKVLLPSYVCVAVLNAVTACGADPILYDIDPESFNPREHHLRRALERSMIAGRDVAAAVVPHTFGYPCDFTTWNCPFPIVEDCAMAAGAVLRQEEVGAWGKVATFSFYATKMLSTGHGGMVLTNDSAIASTLDDLLRYDHRSQWSRPTWNYRLADLNAALGRSQLCQLDAFLARRSQIAVHYRDWARRAGVEVQSVAPEAEPNEFRFVVLLDDRARWQHGLEMAKIEAKSPVFWPLHRYLGLDPNEFSGTERVFERALSLPIYPSLTDAERDHILDVVNELDR